MHAPFAATVGLLALAGCGVTDGTDQVDDSDVPAIEGCTVQISRPDVGGGASTDNVDPHAETFGADAQPHLVRYSWPAPDSSESAAFLWRTDVDTLASQVQWAAGSNLGEADLTNTSTGASFLFGGIADLGENRIHELHLCGDLTPSTTYSYRVGGAGNWSDIYEFTTPGEPGTFDTFRVGIAGDSRGAYDVWAAVLANMDEADVDFVMFSGDMVQLGINQDEWDAWWGATGDIAARLAIVPAHGNHEFLAQHYFAQFALPNNEEWFHVVYGNLVVVSLNDTVRDVDYLAVNQVDYMNEAFGRYADYRKFAMHHRPTYTINDNHSSDESLRGMWGPVFDEHNVIAVINGHNHTYERSLPIRADAESTLAEGTTYIVSGGAGAPLYEGNRDEWFGNVTATTEHYIIADFSAGEIELNVYDMGGTVIDRVVFQR